MTAEVIIEAVLFVASTGLFFNERFRANLFLIICAGLIAVTSTVLLTVEVTKTVARNVFHEETARAAAPLQKPADVTAPAVDEADLGSLDPNVRASVALARHYAARAEIAAAAARAGAELAYAAAARARAGETETYIHLAGNAQVDECEWSNNACNGYGVLVVGLPNEASARYAGQYRGGHKQGLGLRTYFNHAQETADDEKEYAGNPTLIALCSYFHLNNCRRENAPKFRGVRVPNSAQDAELYEGEYSRDAPSGVGVCHWDDGARYAGSIHENIISGSGIYRSADGSRYEGEWANDKRNGYGVLWDAQGRVISQGLWNEGALTTPLSR